MPRVTLYVKDQDADVWDEARSLAKGSEDSLSSMATEGLREVVAKRKRAAETSDGMAEVVLEGTHASDPDKARKVRFVGVCVAEEHNASFFLTRRGKVVVEDGASSHSTTIAVFDSLQDFLNDDDVRSTYTARTLNEVAEAAGSEFVEDLD